MPGIKFLPDVESLRKEESDYHLPMGSLPRLMRNEFQDFDRTIKGYLQANTDRVEVLRKELDVEGKTVIGISWKSFKSLNQSKKSMELKDFEKIFKGLDVVLLNLQYGEVDEEIREFTKETGIEVLQCSSVDNREDLDGLAALIEMCDLVVSTSNVTIHMAGALAKETWVLLPYVANFWWLLDRTDSIWYPTIKLYRQKSLNDWAEIFPLIRKDLQNKFEM
jgi:ADP-heptose:LPS heptosyltransferase